MPLVALAYPELAQKNREWIEDFRSKHDELYARVVKAHFTLVFPVADVEVSEFIHHIQKMLEGVHPIHFVLRCAVLVKDAFNTYSHVLLVPDEGYSNIVKLHDQLYTGLLSRELRLDIPFIPHIGVGNAEDVMKCKALVDKLNTEHFEIAGAINEIEIVDYVNDAVKPVQRLRLGKDA